MLMRLSVSLVLWFWSFSGPLFKHVKIWILQPCHFGLRVLRASEAVSTFWLNLWDFRTINFAPTPSAGEGQQTFSNNVALWRLRWSEVDGKVPGWQDYIFQMVCHIYLPYVCLLIHSLSWINFNWRTFTCDVNVDTLFGKVEVLVSTVQYIFFSLDLVEKIFPYHGGLDATPLPWGYKSLLYHEEPIYAWNKQ